MALSLIFLADAFPGIPAALGLSCALTLAIYSQLRRGRMHSKSTSKKV